MRQSFFAGLLLPLVLVAAGCLDADCPDCGPCGFTGPAENPGKGVNLSEHGVTKDGIAAVQLQLEEGPCHSVDSKPFWVAYDAGVVTVSPADGLTRLDTTSTSRNVASLSWTDRKLSVVFERSGLAVVLTFNEPGKGAKVSCTGADHVITCVPI